jgi:hypothetical protein
MNRELPVRPEFVISRTWPSSANTTIAASIAKTTRWGEIDGNLWRQRAAALCRESTTSACLDYTRTLECIEVGVVSRPRQSLKSSEVFNSCCQRQFSLLVEFLPTRPLADTDLFVRFHPAHLGGQAVVYRLPYASMASAPQEPGPQQTLSLCRAALGSASLQQRFKLPSIEGRCGRE